MVRSQHNGRYSSLLSLSVRRTLDYAFLIDSALKFRLQTLGFRLLLKAFIKLLFIIFYRGSD